MTAFRVPPTCCLFCVHCFSVRLFSHFVAHCPYDPLAQKRNESTRYLNRNIHIHTHRLYDLYDEPLLLQVILLPISHTHPPHTMFLAPHRGSTYAICNRQRDVFLFCAQKQILVFFFASAGTKRLCWLPVPLFFFFFSYKTFFFLSLKPQSLLRALSTLPFPTAGCAHILLVRVNRE
ncbi:membrane-associated protein, putative [Bodo saltans]|uniref:Membrane-associated protein, putative n=1 Tax=Bodo saltans TaxID=75058 RepID=A0A0S4IRG9_BODSA|nr:membrane-associated protein, putative [Bodo saltans]|eukprot:CUF47453.1 membrane-associated protein, putative [Bodo saltans]